MVSTDIPSTALQTPFLTGGARSINFFNGRLLTAEDLSTERDINHAQHQQLGQTIGSGIVDGLQVQLSTTTAGNTSTSIVTVTKGLALNRKGQALSLPYDLDVVLVLPKAPSTAEAGIFQVCEAPTAQPAFTGNGPYILVLSPASGFEERAPMNGWLPDDQTTADCGSRYVVEGVQFGWIKLDISGLTKVSNDTRADLNQLMTKNDRASLSKLRNRLAHLCFGTEELSSYFSDPFGQVNGKTSDAGALADLRAQQKLSDCDVPLALLYWKTSGIQFVDMGSVRRRPLPGPPSQSWPLTMAGGYTALGEAISLQFQEHIAWLMQRHGLPASLKAIDYFRYLPAAGILPFADLDVSVSTDFEHLLDYLPFFQKMTCRKPVYMEGTKVEHLIRDSLSYRPIDLDEQEMLWLYLVRENMQPIVERKFKSPQAYLLFTCGHIPYQGDARYDLARWNYSNYS